MVVMEALCRFVTERNEYFAKIERMAAEAERKRLRKEMATAMSYEEWQEIKMLTAMYIFIHNDPDKPPYHHQQ